MTILGKVRYNFKGNWQSSTSYLVNDTISYLNRTYRCVSSHSNQTPPNVTYWELMSATMSDRGTWSSSTAYNVGDVVLVDNGYFANTMTIRNFANTGQSGQLFMANTYICTTAHTNQTPQTATSYWSLMAQGNSKNHKAYLWAPNMGIVPAKFYPGNSAPGWANTSSVNARFGDSPHDGGAGWCGEGQVSSRPGWITRNGTVLTWGFTSTGSNGFGDNNNQAALNELSFPFNEYFDGSLPTPDGDMPKCIQWIRGWGSDIVLFNNGEVYCWGYGTTGQNGSGNNNNINYPVRAGNNNNTQVLRGKRAIRIASTTWGSITQGNVSAANYALMSDGTLWSWGYNGYGQLGIGSVTAQNVPQQITTSGIIGGTSVVDIWAGGGDAGAFYILDNLGNMYACGRNDVGQLGINSTTDATTLTLVKAWGITTGRLKKFVIGNKNTQHYCMAIDVAGNLWTWGMNNYGQLGFDNTTNLSTPTQVTWNASNVTNVWSSGGYSPFTITTRNTAAGNNQVYTCGNNTGWNLGRIQATSAAAPLTLVSGYSGEITHGQNGSSGTTNTQGTTVAFVLNTYRFEAMQVEVTSSGTYYGNLTNVMYATFYGASENGNLFTVAGVYERSTGEKYFCGHQGCGQAGQYFHDSAWLNTGTPGTTPNGFTIGNGNGTGDQFLSRGIMCANGANGNYNYLGKRLRYMPTGLDETDFFVGWGTGLQYATGLYWFDKYGNVYYSGMSATVNSTNYTSMRYAQPSCTVNMQKIPYML